MIPFSQSGKEEFLALVEVGVWFCGSCWGLSSSVLVGTDGCVVVRSL